MATPALPIVPPTDKKRRPSNVVHVTDEGVEILKPDNRPEWAKSFHKWISEKFPIATQMGMLQTGIPGIVSGAALDVAPTLGALGGMTAGGMAGGAAGAPLGPGAIVPAVAGAAAGGGAGRATGRAVKDAVLKVLGPTLDPSRANLPYPGTFSDIASNVVGEVPTGMVEGAYGELGGRAYQGMTQAAGNIVRGARAAAAQRAMDKTIENARKAGVDPETIQRMITYQMEKWEQAMAANAKTATERTAARTDAAAARDTRAAQMADTAAEKQADEYLAAGVTADANTAARNAARADAAARRDTRAAAEAEQLSARDLEETARQRAAGEQTAAAQTQARQELAQQQAQVAGDEALDADARARAQWQAENQAATANADALTATRTETAAARDARAQTQAQLDEQMRLAQRAREEELIQRMQPVPVVTEMNRYSPASQPSYAGLTELPVNVSTEVFQRQVESPTMMEARQRREFLDAIAGAKMGLEPPVRAPLPEVVEPATPTFGAEPVRSSTPRVQPVGRVVAPTVPDPVARPTPLPEVVEELTPTYPAPPIPTQPLPPEVVERVTPTYPPRPVFNPDELTGRVRPDASAAPEWIEGLADFAPGGRIGRAGVSSLLNAIWSRTRR